MYQCGGQTGGVQYRRISEKENREVHNGNEGERNSESPEQLIVGLKALKAIF